MASILQCSYLSIKLQVTLLYVLSWKTIFWAKCMSNIDAGFIVSQIKGFLPVQVCGSECPVYPYLYKLGKIFLLCLCSLSLDLFKIHHNYSSVTHFCLNTTSFGSFRVHVRNTTKIKTREHQIKVVRTGKLFLLSALKSLP